MVKKGISQWFNVINETQKKIAIKISALTACVHEEDFYRFFSEALDWWFFGVELYGSIL